MAKKAFLGIDDRARRISKVYLGVGGVARKVVRGYIGVGGKARPFFSDGAMYYGVLTSKLSSMRHEAAAASAGDYAFVYGFYSPRNGEYNIKADTFNKSLTKVNNSFNGSSVHSLAAATAGDHAVFAGGAMNNISIPYIYEFSSDLTSQAINYLTYNSENLAGASVGGYALFAGGEDRDKNATCKNVSVISSTLTLSATTELSAAAAHLCGISTDTYAVFAGGVDSTDYANNNKNNVSAYNSSLTRISGYLSVARVDLAGGHIGEHILFAGGGTLSGDYFDTVDVFDQSLTRTLGTPLSVARSELSGGSLDGTLVFAGGKTSSGAVKTTDYYDESLTRSNGKPLTYARYGAASTKIAQYFFIAGGYVTNDNIDRQTTIEAYS